MFSKIIFVLALVCVVNASVLTTNDFDDDPETEIASNPKSCNFQECDQRCRRLKYHGGLCTCSCTCSNFLNAEDDLKTEVDDKKNDCNPQECDQRCRRLKFRGGACICSCTCSKFLNAEDVSEENPSDLEDLLSLKEDNPVIELIASKPKKCNLRKCEKRCRKLQFSGGACVDGRCMCENFLNAEDDLKTEVETRKDDCNPQECDQRCRRLKFRGGACVKGRCKCDNFLNAEGAMNDLDESFSLDDNFVTDSSLSKEDFVDEYSHLDTKRLCRIAKCNRTCTRHGYENATCVKGRCKCFSSIKTAVPISELAEDPTKRHCNQKACEQFCRALKFPGGACVNSRCKCDNSFKTEETSPLNDVTSAMKMKNQTKS